MAKTFGASQLYSVEGIVNEIADVLIHAGFEVGEHADEQNWDGTPMRDMSGVLDRLVGCEHELASAVGLVRAYEMHRQSQAVRA
jgi:hypothetical protein